MSNSVVLENENPRIVIVDASKMTRMLIAKTVAEALPNAELMLCERAQDALEHCESGVIDLVTTSLSLPDIDGLNLCRQIRESSPQRYIPIIVVSGEVTDRLYRRDMGDDVTDYFDKSHGFKALGAFVQGYVCPDESVKGHVLYVEDSRVVALATRRMIESSGLSVTHVVSVEEALELLEPGRNGADKFDYDLVLTDVYLKGGLTGKELLEQVRTDLDLSRSQLPILVMTGDDNRNNQTNLLHAGANDLVEKPVEESLLINKLRFQLQLSRGV